MDDQLAEALPVAEEIVADPPEVARRLIGEGDPGAQPGMHEQIIADLDPSLE